MKHNYYVIINTEEEVEAYNSRDLLIVFDKYEYE